MSPLLIITLALGAGLPVDPDPPPAPAPVAPAGPLQQVPSWLRPHAERAWRMIPTPLGWLGAAGLGISAGGALVAAGTLTGAATAVWQGRREQAAHDAAREDDATTRARHLAASRRLFDVARILGVVGSVVLGGALVTSLACAVVVIVDETFLSPRLRSRHPTWAMAGPLLGTREPPPGWPPSFLPAWPGVFAAPTDEPASAHQPPAPAHPPASGKPAARVAPRAPQVNRPAPQAKARSRAESALPDGDADEDSP